MIVDFASMWCWLFGHTWVQAPTVYDNEKCLCCGIYRPKPKKEGE